MYVARAVRVFCFDFSLACARQDRVGEAVFST